MKIDKVKVYGLDEAIRASKYPKSVDTDKVSSDITDTVKALGRAHSGSGHDNFLNGIIVQFDLTCSIKMWTEAERYHFFDFVSSQSTMHCITRFNALKQCNRYVNAETVAMLNGLIEQYKKEPTDENYLTVLYNVPTGFEITARMTTNYRQLKTIYHQRKDHRLHEWRKFCKWIEGLPRFKEICLGGN